MRKSLTFLLFTLSVATASPAFAQDAALIQAARKEGKVVWHTSLALPSSTAIAHYPKIVPEKDAPNSWKDLLNSKWNGKMVSAHPGYSGIIMTHVLALANLYGWEYFRDLAKNKLHLVQSANDPAGIVASGERPVGVNGAEYFYYKTLKQGNPIKIVYPKEGVPLVVAPVAIA